ncbi:MAG: rod shape-determining protein MreD [Rhodospirillales bacterium]|nr:MAG: rod shape-determining protein MreD [Rhodospirillales bacterium]
MKRSAWQGLDTAARTLTPGLVLVVLVFMGQLPYSLSGHNSITPYFVLMGVFYWGLHRPDLLPAVVVFLVGLMQDALEGEPFGVNAFVLIAVYWLVSSQQRHFKGRPFLVVWLGFAAAALIADLLRWLLVSFVLGTALAPWSIMLEYVLTVTFYPVLTVAFALAHKTLPRGGASDFID